MTTFESLQLPEFLIESLTKMKITTPTPIQQEAIPPAIEGHDILASAQTGSGKTLAYMVPLIINLFNNPDQSALILLPTRELANQVRTTFTQIRGRGLDLHAAVLIGGEPMGKQFAQLRRKPRLIIGTPGRICDHLNRGTLNLSSTSFLILDEMDRMLDMGFSDDLEFIRGKLPEKKQTFMFSATLPPRIEKLSHKYLNNPKRVAIGSALEAAKEIEQSIVHTSRSEKFDRLVEEIEAREGSIIVFVRTKRGADELADQLRELSHKADAIHGDLHQRKRERVVHAFRNQKSRIMVATDIAARGLDVPHIQHVINYDLPECPEDYIHRIGRTGRAGAKGYSLSFISPEDGRKWREIHLFMNPQDAASKKGDRGRGGGFRGRGDGSQRGSYSGFSRSRGESRGFGSRFERDRSGDSFASRSSFDERPKRTFRSKEESFGNRRFNDEGSGITFSRRGSGSEGRDRRRPGNRFQQERRFS